MTNLIRKDFIFKDCEDATEVETYVFYDPKSVNLGPRPIVIIIHGGWNILGSRDMINQAHVKYFTNRDYVVVVPNYRLCPQVALIDGPITDIADCYTWMQEGLPELLKEDKIELEIKKIVSMGYSAGGALALSLGSRPNPPLAICDFYGMKYYADPFWSAPNPSAVAAPIFPEELVNKIYDDPVLTEWSSPPNPEAPPPTKGVLPKANYKNPPPRIAWMSTVLKSGLMRALLQGGNVEEADPTIAFSKDFPPTIFMHGSGDIGVPVEQAQRAYEQLKDLGVKTDIHIVKNAPHAYDFLVTEEDEEWKDVEPGLKFLTKFV